MTVDHRRSTSPDVDVHTRRSRPKLIKRSTETAYLHHPGMVGWWSVDHALRPSQGPLRRSSPGDVAGRIHRSQVQEDPMTKRTPKPPMITLRAGKLSATVPLDVLLRLAPAARQ